MKQIAEDFAVARNIGAAEIAIYLQLLPSNESSADLVGRKVTPEHCRAALTIRQQTGNSAPAANH